MNDDMRVTFRGEPTVDCLRFHWLRHDSLLGDRVDELPWSDIQAVTGLRRQYVDGSRHRFLEFFTDNGVWDLGDRPFEDGWDEVAKGDGGAFGIADP